MPLKVFYLDDEVELLEIFRDTFSSGDFSIKTFSDPMEFVESVNNNAPDLVLLDYRLSGCTGDEIASKIKSKIPKILITGELDAKPETEFEKIITKPYKASELETLMRSFQRSK